AKQRFQPNRRDCAVEVHMLYMVVEHFKDAPAIYRRLREKGRMMPEGLEYVSSWIDVDLKICWQLMHAKDESLFERWIDNWKDLMDFEIVPVRTSAEVREMMEKKRR
ncbi:MAG TPA: DUF3303 family protein, partial [Candidatus Udaeobacter sp.]|nr:DUF3303 family protein [Candidatus Udaeobacter sp.]